MPYPCLTCFSAAVRPLATPWWYLPVSCVHDEYVRVAASAGVAAGHASKARQTALPPAGAVRDRTPRSDGDLEEQLEAVLVVPLLADLDEPQPRDGGERGRVVRLDAGTDDTYVGFPCGPPEQLPGDCPRVPLPPVSRIDRVADLDPSLLVGRPVEAAATDDDAEVRVEDQAGDPLSHGRVLGDLRHPTLPGRPGPLLDEVAAHLETGESACRGGVPLGERDQSVEPERDHPDPLRLSPHRQRTPRRRSRSPPPPPTCPARA